MRASLELALVPLSALVAWVLTGRVWPALIALGVAGVTWFVVQNARVRRRLTAVQDAMRRFDAPALHAAVANARSLELLLRAEVREELTLREGLAFLMEENYGRALEVLRSVDLRSAHPRTRLAVETDVAVCLAQLGRTDEALALAQTCAARARAEFPDESNVHEGVLGIVHQLGGHNEAALPHLEAALASRIEHRGVEAIVAYHLGEALAGLGRLEDARAAWARAYAAAPETPWGRRAQSASR